MTDLPIPFNAAMIRANLAGRKTQTRREIDFPGIENVFSFRPVMKDQRGRGVYEMIDKYGGHLSRPAGKHTITHHYTPKYAVGDRLWVREAWRTQREFDDQKPSEIVAQFKEEWGAPSIPTFYEADGKCDGHSIDQWQESEIGRLRQARFMPRCASRMTLIVTDVRIERLQDISEADAIAEGCFKGKASGRVFSNEAAMHLGGNEWANARDWYADLWNQINGPDAWDKNPWVAAYVYTPIFKNIDEIGGEND